MTEQVEMENVAETIVETTVYAIETVAVERNPVTITPTIGRVVWFRPDVSAVERGLNLIDGSAEECQPLAAMIAYVHNAHTVNLAGFDQYGYPFQATGVTLLTGNETDETTLPYAQWMPYQLATAK